ncbi:Dysferlin [Gossypium australe]|uniref:Dysferlin n=1 Tax=Gossypium australe TaxID=47621 RepID=A0A5B6VT48_9ROSI|nr:Dysferlin [Gossypium australe]
MNFRSRIPMTDVVEFSFLRSVKHSIAVRLKMEFKRGSTWVIQSNKLEEQLLFILLTFDGNCSTVYDKYRQSQLVGLFHGFSPRLFDYVNSFKLLSEVITYSTMNIKI